MGETRFELTSVHNVSLRDAWGKVLQGVMEMLPAVEELMLNFTAVSRVLPDCSRSDYAMDGRKMVMGRRD